jgi:murein L,D-transpeptidase YcbB/YkuD
MARHLNSNYLLEVGIQLTSFRTINFACCLFAAQAASTLATAGQVEELIGARVTTIADTPKPEVSGIHIAAGPLISAFYAMRQNRPAWYGTTAGDELFTQIEFGIENGFRAEDFHAAPLQALRRRAESGDPAAIADYEIVATDAAARLLHHLFFGKVDAEKLDPDWNFERPVVSGSPAETLNGYLDAGSFGTLVSDVTIKHAQYLALLEALKRYREIEARGGWPEVPAGNVLKPGADDPAVVILRQRLAVTGDFTDAQLQSTVYDAPLEAAVRGFQTRHGLDADGVIGAKTFQALNRPVSTRIDQLRLSLERARWLLRGLGDDYVLVNIAGARTYLFKGGQVVWRTRSIVGQPYRKTPVFRDEIRYMEINPTWTVPVSIFRKDKLARIRKDPGYLARGGYSVRDSKGRPIDPSSVDWSAQNPPVTLVQRPGPKNALGRVKFMFPNKHAVYLHDTDDRSLFGRTDRDISSGCVRIEDPFRFADLLMAGSSEWSGERRESILESGKTTRIDLPTPLPVLLTYWTAWVEGGQVQFREDIYERDQRILKALNGRFR